MGDMCYKPLIDKMKWSYSRIGTYDSCPHGFFLKYIDGIKGEDKFYSSYGSFVHKIIEQHYIEGLTSDQMLTRFLDGFSDNVKGKRPKQSTVNGYIEKGKYYFKNFKEFPFNPVATELKVEFEIGGVSFIGFIDFLGERDGEFYIVDNKSRELKPRSCKGQPTAKDAELDVMLRQLYLYSEGVKQKFGKYPKALCFNCFKNGEFIIEPFCDEKLEEAKAWALESIRQISEDDEFYPQYDYFYCNWICDAASACEHFQNINREMRRFR